MSELHDLVAPYALDALDDAEARRFETHLRDCARCQSELSELREAVVHLAEEVATPPPEHLRAAILDAVGRTEVNDVVVPISRGRTRSGFAWTVAVAAAAIAAVFFGMWSAADRQLDQALEVAAVFEAPDAVLVDLTSTFGPARLVYSESLGHGVFSGAELVDLGEDEIYALWLIDSNGPGAAGTLDSGESVLFVGVAPGQVFAVTVEPSPGVESPTSDPILATEL